MADASIEVDGERVAIDWPDDPLGRAWSVALGVAKVKGIKTAALYLWVTLKAQERGGSVKGTEEEICDCAWYAGLDVGKPDPGWVYARGAFAEWARACGAPDGREDEYKDEDKAQVDGWIAFAEGLLFLGCEKQ